MSRRLILLSRLLGLALVCLVAARATTVVPPEFPTLVNDSDYIIRAVTKNVTAEKRATADGGSKIVTRVEFEVLEVVAGNPPAQVTLEFLGGRVGKEAMKVDGMPQFKVGDEDILFVRDAGTSICPLYGMMHGRYGVQTQAATGRKIMVRSDGTALESVAQISAPLASASISTLAPRPALTPAAFIQQIQASVR